ncbi:MAG TPA: hypothetical protein IAB21_03405 [Candidatus Avelusimicrobium excrementipullorum]|nr:hypothetical protein [Candidatus Avelusimicrobium excrementipullorum]
MSRKKDAEVGCAILAGIAAVILMAICWMLENQPILCVILLVIPVLIYVCNKYTAEKQRHQKLAVFKSKVEQAILKWQDWQNKGLPIIQNADLRLDEGEILIYEAPYLLKVGAGRQVHTGVLYITNKRFLFLADTTTKDISFKRVLAVTAGQTVLHVVPNGRDKMLHLTPQIGEELGQRLQVADAYAVWFLQNRGKYEMMEEEVFKILGVKKEGAAS